MNEFDSTFDDAFRERVTQYRDLKAKGSDDAAIEYYLEYLLPIIIAKVRNDYDTGPLPKQAKVLVTLLGRTMTPSIITIELVRPKYLIVVSTKETTKNFKRIKKWLADHSENVLLSDEHQKEIVIDHLQCDKMYAKVRQARQELDIPPTKSTDSVPLLVDITGGSKLMSSVAAQIAWSHPHYATSYVDFNGSPGSEQFVILPKPATLMAERDFITATDLFNRGLFHYAEIEFKKAANSMYQPDDARFRWALAEVYHHWSLFEFTKNNFTPKLERLTSKLEQQRYDLPTNFVTRLELQIKILTSLSQPGTKGAESQHYFGISLYLLAQHHDRHNRPAFAILLFYRCIENCLKNQLKSEMPGFSCRSPKWSLLEQSVEDFDEKYTQWSKEVYGDDREISRPPTVGLIASALLLMLTGDSLLTTALDYIFEDDKSEYSINSHARRIAILKKLRSLCECRNDSILAHGISTVSEDALKDIQKACKNILKTQFESNNNSNGLQQSFEKFVKMVDFVHLSEH